ncbi:AAA family ATPase [Brevundimonas sp. 374]|uniref:AAA family ATPase n=1 Tax=Brevundimonas sp. 374 TaxID=1150400 RepID=UPI000887A0AE|nr:AAA family ATPase [Brevundimonas sp. 374]SDQ28061.1 AAA domain-containing protein, putative AbiEii toxin, Type IV TA system [Brevundimonas sp. 374]
MQYFERNLLPVPSAFRSGEAAVMRRELMEFMKQARPRRAQSFPPSQELRLDDEVQDALIRLFNGKCAFCERRTYVFPHRFRPLQEALPLAQVSQAHLYYCWLGTDWGNLYSICAACDRRPKNLFPVGGSGRGALPPLDELELFASENSGVWRWPHRDRPLVLDPCRTRAFPRFLSFDFAGGISALEAAGHETISVFGLDRPELVEERAAAFSAYIGMIKASAGNGLPRDAFDFASMAFGGGWYILLRRLVKYLNERLNLNLNAGRTRIHTSLERILSMPVGHEVLDEAVEDLRNPEVAKAPPSQGRSLNLQGRQLVRASFVNFKSLEALTVDIAPPISPDPDNGRPLGEASALLLLGENAAGKSSVLEGVALALIGADGRSGINRPWRSFTIDPSMLGGRRQARHRQATVRLSYADGGATTLTVSDGFQDSGDTENLPSVFAYGAFRQYSDRGERFHGGGTVGTLFRSDLVLRNPEEWLLSLDKVRFSLVARTLSKVFELEGEFEFIEADAANSRCLIRRQVGEGADAVLTRTPLTVASSGFRSILAMLCDVFEGIMGKGKAFVPLSDAQPVILIDEIEAHLHPRWKMRIITALRQILPSATFIFTSHDPLCLRGMHDGEVAVLRQAVSGDDERGDHLPVFIESITDLPNIDTLTIEQLLTSDLFDMFSTDSVQMETSTAELSSLLALRATGGPLTPAEKARLQSLEREVLSALPLGTSKVQSMILDAVAIYLDERSGRQSADSDELEEGTKRLIADALGSYLP